MEWEEIVFLTKADESPPPATVDAYNNTVTDTIINKMGMEDNDVELENAADFAIFELWKRVEI